jgi:Fic family protein
LTEFATIVLSKEDSGVISGSGGDSSVSNEEIFSLDAAYKPFPSFEEWSKDRELDTVRWDRYKASFESHQNLSKDVLDRAKEIAKRAAAIDTGALEGLYEADKGFTFTVALETAAWEVEMAERGEQVRPLFEAQLHAYDFVLDLATKAEQITEASIRTLQEVVCAAQSTYRVVTAIGFQEQPLPKGRYKSLANHVRTRKGTNHSYAPVDITPSEMDRLVRELRSEQFLFAHPVRQAAYAHYALVCIHPFADGNGRVARALASTFTYRAISMPIVILTEHKEDYLGALELADSGAFNAFEDFMMLRALDTIQLVDESVRSASSPQIVNFTEELNSLYFTRGGYTLEQVDAFGQSLIQFMAEQFKSTLRESSSQQTTGEASLITGGQQQPPPMNRSPRIATNTLRLMMSSNAPIQASVGRTFHLSVPKNAGGDDDVLLTQHPQGETFAVRIDDLTPRISGVIQIRAKMFCGRIVADMQAQLLSQAREAAKKIYG